jgi:hypothetical protein
MITHQYDFYLARLRRPDIRPGNPVVKWQRTCGRKSVPPAEAYFDRVDRMNRMEVETQTPRPTTILTILLILSKTRCPDHSSASSPSCRSAPFDKRHRLLEVGL